MSILDPFGYGTHEVLNQAPAMADYDAYSDDPALGKILSIFDAE
jgi:putative acyl-CoA dehydrogenase